MMFIPDNTFKSIIFSELQKGDRSISSLHRKLTEENHKVHRLVLTGYLKAMEDMGVLSSKDFPPSKVYSISATTEKDIYGTVQEICANLEDVSDEKRPEIILYFFQKLFRRPVFQSEMALAGFEGDPEAFAAKVPNDERLELKKQLAKKGYKIPLKDLAFVLRDRNYDKEFEIIVQSALLRTFRVSGLCVDTKQTKLGL
jgi:DNA-binding HxlR family transcriptional regulator